jgi:hypothetical protein
MKKTLSLFVTILFAISGGTQTPSRILTILEKDPDQLYKKDLPAFTNRKFADINSTLQININKEQILNAVAQGNIPDGLPTDIVKAISVLEKILQKQSAFMDSFRVVIATYNSTKTGNEAKTFNAAMNKLAQIVINAQTEDQQIRLYMLRNKNPELFVTFFAAVKQRLDELKRYEESVAATQSSSVQLGAWLIRDTSPVPVHLRGFDNLKQGEFYEVARWNFIPTEAQLAQIKDLQKNSIKGSLDVQSVFRQAVDSFQNQLTRSLEQLQSDKIKKAFDTLKAHEAAIADTVLRKNITDLQKLLESATDLVVEKVKYYQALSIQAKDILPLTGHVIGDITEIDAALKELTTKINNSKENIKKGVDDAGGNVKLALADLTTYFTNLPDSIHKLIDAVKPDDFRDLKKQYDFDINTLEFSKDILKFSFKDLPGGTELDLRRTGMRANGDHIVLKLTVRNGADNKVLTADDEDIELNLLASHVEGTVGVALAMPVSPTALKSGVQVAPYYNILFKGFRNRQQKKYREKGNANDLFAVNFGLHASIPDFNLDGVPEIGVGAVVSFLKDYVQAGWAFNFFEKTGYWFFGTRFPIGPFGANGSATSKNALKSQN